MLSLWAWNNGRVIPDISSWSDEDIADLYRVADKPWLRINMVISLDGNFAGPNRSSRDISHPFDLRMLRLIRSVSDCILVGAKTAVGEKYKIVAQSTEGESVSNSVPQLAVVSNSLQIPTTAPMFSGDKPPVIITRRTRTLEWNEQFEILKPHATIVVLGKDALMGSDIRSALHDQGLNQIVCEGGPALLNTMLECDCVDELSITTSPTVLGHVSHGSALGTHHAKFQFRSNAQAHDYLFSRLVRH